MKIIKKGNTIKQIICEFCGAILEYDMVDDKDIAGQTFNCPVCNNKIKSNIRADKRDVVKPFIYEAFTELHRKLIIYMRSKTYYDGVEVNAINDVMRIISEEQDNYRG